MMSQFIIVPCPDSSKPAKNATPCPYHFRHDVCTSPRWSRSHV